MREMTSKPAANDEGYQRWLSQIDEKDWLGAMEGNTNTATL